MNGFLIIDKPKGITSHDVVMKVKTALNAKKVGHTGTLDPFATGILVLCINEATHLARFFENDAKEYIAVAKLGEETDTYDLDGRITNRYDVENIKEDNIRSVIGSFKGVCSQMPPMFSAVKRNGIPLYKLARKGIDVERRPRDVYVHDIDVMDISIPYVKFRVMCSKGTYIRSLCYDIGRRLGCGAHLASLERIKNGRFSIDESLKLDMVSPDSIINIEDVLNGLPAFYVDKSMAFKILNGLLPFPEDACKISQGGGMIRYMFQGRIIAVGEFKGERIRLVRTFKEALN